MRFLLTLLVGTALALPAVAQTHSNTHRARSGHGAAQTGYPGRPTENDKGPFTPEANAAYDGGGTILVGRPGEPPPPPSAVLQHQPGRPLPPPPMGQPMMGQPGMPMQGQPMPMQRY